MNKLTDPRGYVDVTTWKTKSNFLKNETEFEFNIVGSEHNPAILVKAVREAYLMGHEPAFEIDRVIFNNPATIVYWKDGTKTVVRCQEGDTYNAETGLLMCIAKRAYGNNGKFNDVLKAWVKPISQDPLTVEHVLDVLHEMYGRGR